MKLTTILALVLTAAGILMAAGCESNQMSHHQDAGAVSVGGGGMGMTGSSNAD